MKKNLKKSKKRQKKGVCKSHINQGELGNFYEKLKYTIDFMANLKCFT